MSYLTVWNFFNIIIYVKLIPYSLDSLLLWALLFIRLVLFILSKNEGVCDGDDVG